MTYLKKFVDLVSDAVFLRQSEMLKKVVIKNIKSNKKPLCETIVVFTYYVNVTGLPRSQAEEQINSMITNTNYNITKEELGVKFVQHIWLAITESCKDHNTRVEITTI